ncbi:MAG: erythromycin esterase family protein [Fluviicola sp.]
MFFTKFGGTTAMNQSKIIKKFFYLFFATAFFLSTTQCNQRVSYKPVILPANLSAIPDDSFAPLGEYLEGAEIIGISEATHGMNEPLDFRNSLIKYLVKKHRVRIIAFESGLSESRIVNEYINGGRIGIDAVLKKGISYGFGDFKQNKHLLIWLRKINWNKPKEDRVQFYGFDMVGNAPNPYEENPELALLESMKFVRKLKTTSGRKLLVQLKSYLPYLHSGKDGNDPNFRFERLSQQQKKELINTVNDLIKWIKDHKNQFTNEEFNWGLQLAKCGLQNIYFLQEIIQPNSDQHLREKFMFNNLQWIMRMENDRPIVLFGHLAHMTKELNAYNEDGKNMLPHPMLGEYIGKKYGNKYQVIGNFFSYAKFDEGTDSLDISTFSRKIEQHYKAANFYLKPDKSKKLFSTPTKFGTPSFVGDLWMNPANGFDILLFTKKQHFYKKK